MQLDPHTPDKLRWGRTMCGAVLVASIMCAAARPRVTPYLSAIHGMLSTSAQLPTTSGLRNLAGFRETTTRSIRLRNPSPLAITIVPLVSTLLLSAHTDTVSCSYYLATGFFRQHADELLYFMGYKGLQRQHHNDLPWLQNLQQPHNESNSNFHSSLRVRAAIKGRHQLYPAQTRRQSCLKTTGFLVFCFVLILFFLLSRTLLPLSNFHVRISFSLQIGHGMD